MIPSNLKQKGLEFISNFIWSFPVGGTISVERNRNWLHPGKKWQNFTEHVASYIPLSAIKQIENIVTSPPVLDIPPPQYYVFNYIPRNVSILTYNYDGYANKFCPQRDVFAMHGEHNKTPMRDDVEGKKLQMAMYGIEVAPKDKHYFEKELNDSFSDYHEIIFLSTLFNCTDLVIIGYSFADQNGSLNDIESFKRVCYFLVERPVTITLVGPDTGNLAERLKEHLNTYSVFEVPAYWNHLARAIISVSYNSFEMDIRGSIRHPDLVVAKYMGYLNSNHKDLDQQMDILSSMRILPCNFQSMTNHINAMR